MLLCGSDNFKNIFVRIDILERLFLMIFNSNKENQKGIFYQGGAGNENGPG